MHRVKVLRLAITHWSGAPIWARADGLNQATPLARMWMRAYKSRVVELRLRPLQGTDRMSVGSQASEDIDRTDIKKGIMLAGMVSFLLLLAFVS